MCQKILLLNLVVSMSCNLLAQTIAESDRITPEAAGASSFGHFGFTESMVLNDEFLAFGTSSNVCIYKNEFGDWSLDTIITFSQSINNTFGDNLLLFDDYLFIGQSNTNVSEGLYPSIYVYRHLNNQWQLTQTIQSPISDVPDIFGVEMVRAGDLVVFGQYESPQAYRALTYGLTDGIWNFIHVIDEDARQAVMAGNHLILKVNSSYPNTDTLQIKSYDWINENWVCIDTVVTYAAANESYRLINHPYGPELILIHTDYESNNLDELRSYAHLNSAWVIQDGIEIDQIGISHAMDANRLLISQSGNWHGVNSGKVDYYSLHDGEWQYLTELVPTTIGNWDEIGKALNIHDGKAYVSSFELNNAVTYYDGAVLIFNLAGCSDLEACNYNPEIPFDTELCIWPTCHDEMACNFNPEGCEGGDCIYPINSADTDCSGEIDESEFNSCVEIFGCVGDCVVCDLDNDGVVGTNDIIILVSQMD